MSTPGQQQAPHAYQQPPAPYPPHPGHPAGQQPGHPAYPQGGWIDSAGRWQPGSPPPPKKSSNGIVIALCIIAGLLGLMLLGAIARSADSSPSRQDEELAEFSDRLGELADETEAINQLTDELVNDEVLGLDFFESRCVATEVVDEFGAAGALEIDSAYLAADLSTTEAEALADAYVDCVDLKALFARGLESDPASAGLPDFYIDCLFEEIGTEVFRSGLVDEFSGNPPSDSELEQLGAEAGDRCIASFTPEQLDELAAS